MGHHPERGTCLGGERGTDCLSTVHKGEGFGAECTHKSNTALGGRGRMFFFFKERRGELGRVGGQIPRGRDQRVARLEGTEECKQFLS